MEKLSGMKFSAYCSVGRIIFLKDKFHVAQPPALTSSCGICENPVSPPGAALGASVCPSPSCALPCACISLSLLWMSWAFQLPAPRDSVPRFPNACASTPSLGFASLLWFPGGFWHAFGCRGVGLCSWTVYMCFQNSSWMLQETLRKKKKIDASVVQPRGKGGKEGLGGWSLLPVETPSRDSFSTRILTKISDFWDLFNKLDHWHWGSGSLLETLLSLEFRCKGCCI